MQKRGRTVFRLFFFFYAVGGTFSNNRFSMYAIAILFLVSDSRIICRVLSSMCIVVAYIDNITADIEGNAST